VGIMPMRVLQWFRPPAGRLFMSENLCRYMCTSMVEASPPPPAVITGQVCAQAAWCSRHQAVLLNMDPCSGEIIAGGIHG
jgi:hypothetical protein